MTARPTLLTPADRLRAAGKLGPYTTPGTAPHVSAPPSPLPVDPAAVRAWAAEHDIEVSPRGRIPSAVVDAYQQAHREAL